MLLCFNYLAVASQLANFGLSSPDCFDCIYTELNLDLVIEKWSRVNEAIIESVLCTVHYYRTYYSLHLVNSSDSDDDKQLQEAARK